MKYIYRLRILDKKKNETITVKESSNHQKLGLMCLMAKAMPYRGKDHKILAFESNDTTALSYICENMTNIPCNLIKGGAE